MYSATLYTHACAYWINAVVIALNGNLGSLARDAGNLANSDEAVIDFRHLNLKQSLQEQRTGTAQNNLRIVILVLHASHHRSGCLTLAVEVSWNLLSLRQQQFVAVFI